MLLITFYSSISVASGDELNFIGSIGDDMYYVEPPPLHNDFCWSYALFQGLVTIRSRATADRDGAV